MLNHARWVLLLFGTVVLTEWLFIPVPKTFMLEQDTGRLSGFISADQSISFQAMRQKLPYFMVIVKAEPAVESVVGFTGGMRTNSGSMFVSLRPLAERNESALAVIARLRAKLAKEPGANLYLNAVQDLRVGRRESSASYQYSQLSDDLAALREWEPKIRQAFAALPQLADVNSDQQDKGSKMALIYDRESMAHLGIDVADANTLLNNAFE
ncbi:efflux RND transporter permease subunit [Candidatus Pantoea persica]|uniref:efflux RND transporter permease subunit n=1 Tax=Candidatus Pantoea persica TaxID=2518128 RepID=UPI00215D9055|nr:efflux RND transporter permease subunit [Candidatus Pantoea persica]MBA2814776.1 Multidrug transporter MdtC [Candidatus Pantoea persica]